MAKSHRPVLIREGLPERGHDRRPARHRNKKRKATNRSQSRLASLLPAPRHPPGLEPQLILLQGWPTQARLQLELQSARATVRVRLFGARWTPGESAHKDLSGIETPGGRPLLCVSPRTKTAATKQANSARPRAPGLKHPVAAPSASRSSGPASAGC